MIQKVPIEVIDTNEGHVSLVDQFWERFAELAYRGYIQGGRGAVSLDLNGLSEIELSDGSIVSLIDYAVYDRTVIEGLEEDELKTMFTELGKEVDSYDPEKEILVLVYRKTFEQDSAFSVHKLVAATPHLTPAEVYKKFNPIH